MQGKLIVIEGLDSSGKETQSKLLQKKLENMGKTVKRFEFPNYESNSSALVKMYLSGDFGNNADDVSPYSASSFYAVDRFATWKTSMEKFYNNGGIVIADRYTTSNIIHQAGKLENVQEKDDFILWLEDYEYAKMGLPKPDVVVFLHMPTEVSIRLMENRRNKAGTKDKDIHEANYEYLKSTYKNAMDIKDKCGFKLVECCCGDTVRSIEDIHKDIMSIVTDII
ncbi:MAG: deoxynucleoside kinase [Clostridia bacterium]|nr:deoxynucleoside kinase [Clostridia bacterium]